MKVNNKKGFTLAELLIVVAIIGVLVAIAMPTFGAQLERAREAADQANLRSAYAEAMSAYLSVKSGETLGNATVTEGTGTVTIAVKNVKISQKSAGWDSLPDFPFTVKGGKDAAGDIAKVVAPTTPTDTFTATFTVTTSTGAVELTSLAATT